jgi:hypothetical protein
LDLGDGNRFGLVVQVVSAASQRYDFVLRLIASEYGMQTASTRPTWVFEVEFLCRFESDMMGRFVVTDEHLVRI